MAEVRIIIKTDLILFIEFDRRGYMARQYEIAFTSEVNIHCTAVEYSLPHHELTKDMLFLHFVLYGGAKWYEQNFKTQHVKNEVIHTDKVTEQDGEQFEADDLYAAKGFDRVAS